MSDPQALLRLWLISNLRERGAGACAALAARLGVPKSMISKMKCIDGGKECRSIPAHVIPAMAEFFGEWPPGYAPDAVDGERLAMVIEKFERRYSKRVPVKLRAACIAALYRYATLAPRRHSGGEDDERRRDGSGRGVAG